MDEDTSMAEKLVQLQKSYDAAIVERDAYKAKVDEHLATIEARDKEVTRLKVLIADNISFAGDENKTKVEDPVDWDFNDKYDQLLKDMKKKKD